MQESSSAAELILCHLLELTDSDNFFIFNIDFISTKIKGGSIFRTDKKYAKKNDCDGKSRKFRNI